MFPIDTFRKPLEKLIFLLNAHEVKFHLTGGVTNIAYGEPRMTQDIDVVVDNEALRANFDAFIESLGDSEFLFDETDIKRAVEQKGMFQLLDSVEALKLDIYPRELIPGELDRSERIEIFDGMFVPIASLVDTAMAKLIWIEKGSHKSRRDLRQLMRVSSESQRQSILDQAAEIGLGNLLSSVLSEPDEIDSL
jgi:hypothetical protein